MGQGIRDTRMGFIRARCDPTFMSFLPGIEFLATEYNGLGGKENNDTFSNCYMKSMLIMFSQITLRRTP